MESTTHKLNFAPYSQHSQLNDNSAGADASPFRMVAQQKLNQQSDKSPSFSSNVVNGKQQQHSSGIMSMINNSKNNNMISSEEGKSIKPLIVGSSTQNKTFNLGNNRKNLKSFMKDEDDIEEEEKSFSQVLQNQNLNNSSSEFQTNQQIFKTQDYNQKQQANLNIQKMGSGENHQISGVEIGKQNTLDKFGLIKPIEKLNQKKKIKAFNLNNISFNAQVPPTIQQLQGQSQNITSPTPLTNVSNPFQNLGALNQQKPFNINDIINKKELRNANVYSTNPFAEQIDEYKSKNFKPIVQESDGHDFNNSLKMKAQGVGKNELSKVARNLQMPMSVQVSRQNSMENLKLDPEEQKSLENEGQAEPIMRKKPVVNLNGVGYVPKKKIIKKIIRKKNADGTEATTVIMSNANQDKTPPSGTMSNQFTGSSSPAQHIEFEKTAVVDLQQLMSPQAQQASDANGEQKKKIKKIIIKKKKVQPPQTEIAPSLGIVDQQTTQQPQPLQETQKSSLLSKVQIDKSRVGNNNNLPTQSQQQNSKNELSMQSQELRIDNLINKMNSKTELEKMKSQQTNNGLTNLSVSKPPVLDKTQDDEEEIKEVKKPIHKLKLPNSYKSIQQKQDDDEEEEEEKMEQVQKLQKMKQDLEKEMRLQNMKEQKQQTEEYIMKQAAIIQKEQLKKARLQQKKKQQQRQRDLDNEETHSDYQDDDDEEDGSEEERKGGQNRKKHQNTRQIESSEEEEGDEDDEEEDEEEDDENEESEEEGNSDSNDEEAKSNQQIQQQQNGIIQPPQYLALKVAVCNPACYKAFIENLIHGHNLRDTIMNPIPLSVGMLKFSVERHRSGFNRLHPSYYMYLEKIGGGKIQILYAKKRAFNKTANYLISIEKNKSTRTNEICLGKLRANPEGDQYILYDNGENFTKAGKYPRDQIRNEYGVFLFKYEPCNIGNIRKMVTILPQLIYTNIPDQNNPDLSLAYGRDQNGNLVRMIQREWKSMSEKETIFESFHRDGIRNQNYQIFVDNPPAWNPKTNTYVYDFKGRVSQPSIKNFQLIPELDGRKKQTLKDFILQFGKTGKNDFIVDAQYPFSIFQAFGQALSSFDTD